MKNNFLRAVQVFLIILLIAGCGKKENTQNAAAIDSVKLESLDLSGQKVFLKYHFKKDDKFSYRLTTITNTLQTAKTDSLLKSTADQTLTYNFDIEVVETGADKIAELSINISSITFQGNINGQRISYDSKAKNSKEDKDKFGEFEVVTNSPFRARVNEKGEVLEVSRIDKMAEKLIALKPELKEMGADQKTALIKNISDGEIKPRTQLLFRELSPNEVSKDSTWQLSSPATIAVFQIENISKFKVDDFLKVGDDKVVKLTATLNAKWSGEKKGSQEGMNFLFDDPKISGGGTIFFDIDRGLIIKSETSTTVEMGVQVDGKDASQKMKRTFRKDFSSNKNIVELL